MICIKFIAFTFRRDGATYLQYNIQPLAWYQLPAVSRGLGGRVETVWVSDLNSDSALILILEDWNCLDQEPAVRVVNRDRLRLLSKKFLPDKVQCRASPVIRNILI